MENITVSGPSITQKEIDYVADATRNAWYGNANMYNAKFEKAFAEYTCVKHAISLPSCTSAIHLSLLALGVGPGDEVVVPEITWIASAAPITYVGATTVFADVDEKTWCMSAESLEQCITEKTKAVIPVDIYGNMPDMDAILEIANSRGLKVVEDAAEAVGSEYRGRKAGSFGDTGCFSFHGSKTMTTGEGGMLVMDDDGLYNRCMFLRDHGRKPGDVMFFNEEVAFKYKMSSMQAALGLAQIERIEELVAMKRAIFRWYERELSGVEGITLNYEAPGVRNTYWMVSVLLDPSFGLDRKELMDLMKEKNISIRPFFHPLSAIPAFRETPEAAAARERNITGYRISSSAINLPSGLNLDEEKVKYVCTVLKGILKNNF